MDGQDALQVLWARLERHRTDTAALVTSLRNQARELNARAMKIESEARIKAAAYEEMVDLFKAKEGGGNGSGLGLDGAEGSEDDGDDEGADQGGAPTMPPYALRRTISRIVDEQPGLGRVELLDVVSPRVPSSRKSISQTISNMLAREELVDVGGRVYGKGYESSPAEHRSGVQPDALGNLELAS